MGIIRRIIRDDVNELIVQLDALQKEYVLMDTENRKKHYSCKRDRFNGLYRVNKKGLFNVPMGAYKNPCICDRDNLLNISIALKNLTIMCAGYRESTDFIDENTFVYFDPPYRPLTETANFTSYTENLFDNRT